MSTTWLLCSNSCLSSQEVLSWGGSKLYIWSSLWKKVFFYPLVTDRFKPVIDCATPKFVTELWCFIFSLCNSKSAGSNSGVLHRIGRGTGRTNETPSDSEDRRSRGVTLYCSRVVGTRIMLYRKLKKSGWIRFSTVFFPHKIFAKWLKILLENKQYILIAVIM